MSGGTHMYRATTECSACGKTVDVGPFDSLNASTADLLPQWLLPSGRILSWVLSDAMGWRATLCDECMMRPLAVVLAAITERQNPS